MFLSKNQQESSIMTLISVAEASSLTGKSIPTIYRHINSGKLSRTGDKVDTSEVLRVYGAFKKTKDNQFYQNDNQVESQIENIKLSMLQRENEILQAQIDDLKTDRDQWRNQATMLLTHQPEQVTPTGSLLFEKLFGRK